ncbi:hypothetical protein ELQ90_14285 [Labedella phragmitis]|uniref:Oligosaccharide repeat unit polymerase n=1 Tax=Labedella phragmitis TaxID=2498849 RepID=A0A3S4AEK1_9MICO|nr:hypothetical protein [Labedella phragmitis]RWZ46603.1 hypothetical protein ELQ90_14285 [Labedella phragmitis]
MTGIGILTLGVWYGLVVAVASLGTSLGRRVRPSAHLNWSDQDQAREKALYLILTIFSVIGMATVLANAGGISGFLAALNATDANSLKEATGGAAGLTTLRYTTAIAAPLGIHRLLRNRRGFTLAALNAVLLFLNAAVASRLSLLMAVMVLLYLLVTRPVGFRIRKRWILPGAAAVFGLLTLLNYTRNARYYEAAGVSDPVSMSIVQALTYLGTPFQVALGTANAIHFRGATFSQPPDEWWTVLVPTFFRSEPRTGDATGTNRYSQFVDYNASLTTNSAFADTLATFGPWGLVASLVLIASAALLFGHFAQYGNGLALIPGVVLYGMAEYWRILLFSQGIFVYLVIATLIAACAVAAFRGTPNRLREPDLGGGKLMDAVSPRSLS